MSVSFKWFESPEHGGGGPDWVENHIEAYISIAGTHLGVAKAMTAFLPVCEVRDTMQMNAASAHCGTPEALPLLGGDAIWGTPSGAPYGIPGSNHTHGDLIAFRGASPLPPGGASSAGDWILQHTSSSFQKMIATNFSFGIERDEALPHAPSMKLYCVYGHGKRSYWYAHGNEYDEMADSAAGAEPQCVDPADGACAPFDMPLLRKSWIDAEYTDETLYPRIRNGVKLGEGDGTVSLVSLGAMCVEGWTRKRWNPAGIKITTFELPHRPVPSIPRGGANTTTGFNEIIFKVAIGVGDEITDSFVSDMREYTCKMQWD
ncbi:hypothetical protein DFH08DRAFT_861251 [Mycena albidolilacea]|uniref:Uncharacterized protein n=1 Tax=Mycena albidolilacea TaxID=1033008 RepID=A0AAD7A620_9AGAR|nr:hypothetical protein DFH08DRAFT_861251 [Mycena albidolilacea]